MQIGKWMSYSYSSHFSDKFSYKILFISSFGVKDMNLAISAHLQQFSVKQIFRGDFSHRGGSQPGSLTGGAKVLIGR
jgi:hypothetical protein